MLQLGSHRVDEPLVAEAPRRHVDADSELRRQLPGGQLDLEGMITTTMKLDDINEAFDAMKRGEVIRQVITF